ncbi:MAG: ABC transporter permease [Candidatus Wallbacteria bacterium]|nr:ABC transporter permease [Candidatus Wallbacteria bacterium]
MNAITAIASREIHSFFVSLRAYVILTLGLSLFTLFFALLLLDGREASMRSMFKIMEFLFLTIVPILTMGLIAEERRTGTVELLRTAPVSRSAVVLGKYAGALGIYTLMVALTVHFYGVLEHYGAPDRWPAILGYTALLLEGALMLAVGVFASCLTSSQAVACLVTYTVCFGIYALGLIAPYLPESWAPAVAYWGASSHTASMATGLIQTQDLVYFATLTPLFLGLAVWRFKSQE